MVPPDFGGTLKVLISSIHIFWAAGSCAPRPFIIKSKLMFKIGVDIGGQSAKCGIVDTEGQILSRVVIRTNDTEDPSVFIGALASALKRLVEETKSEGLIKGIGVGAPDANYISGCIENATNLTWGKGKVEFVSLLSESMGIPVYMTNDANAAAMGEMMYGAARGMKDFIMITLGTGVGSGIVTDGKLLLGHDGLAGELGLTVAVPGGRPSSCGNLGCLEAYTSASGVAQTAREWLSESDEPSLLRDKERISSLDVYEAALQGDGLAARVFDFTGEILGRSLANFAAFSSPEAIILFGGLAEAGDLIYRPVFKSMNENLPSIWKNRIKLLFSQLNQSDAAILGAAALVEN